MALTKRFISSYQGSADYAVDDVAYEVRTFLDSRAALTPAMFASEFDAIGPVRGKHYPERATFPPPEVMALFPGYTAARQRPEAHYEIEYVDGTKPATRISPTCGWAEVDL